jgi:hypothetical protein
VEPEPDRAETLAARVAGNVGSWRLVGALPLSIIVWLAVRGAPRRGRGDIEWANE